MGRNNYVDLDLYGRGFDGIFGYGAEQENKRQALMKFKAMQRFKERVKPDEYIDLDLYGRGDPRVFGPDAHIQTQKHAQKLMEDAQSRKRDGHVNQAILMLPVGLKAITRKARQLVKRVSSVENSVVETPFGEHVNNEREGATDDRVIPAVGTTQGVKPILEEPEIVSNAPRRVKSKLPSEEVPPYVEPGAVARAVKSISSQDNMDDHVIESSRNAPLFEPAQTAARSSIASRGLPPHKESDSGSSKSAESSNANLEAESNEDLSRHSAEPASTGSEAEVARDVLVGSDEDFPLSFSTNVHNGNRNDYNSTSSEEDLAVSQADQQRVLVDTAGRTDSTGNKMARLFRSGDSDNGSGQIYASEGSSGEAGPSLVNDTYSSTEDEDVSTDETGEVIEVSMTATGLVEDNDAENVTRQFSEVRNAQPVLRVREASIVKVVETGDLLFDGDLANDSKNEIKEAVKARAATESRVAAETAADTTIYDADEEIANDVEHAVDGSSSYGGSGSSEAVDSDEQADASIDNEDMDGSAYVTDSDRSAEAGSSSVVMSSSPEEDSDDIEIETSGDVEEESEEAEEVENEEQEEQKEKSSEEVGDEETEDYGNVRVVDSSDAESDAELTPVEDNDAAEGQVAGTTENESNDDAEANNPQGEGDEGISFWQRLNFFGAIAQGSWTVY